MSIRVITTRDVNSGSIPNLPRSIKMAIVGVGLGSTDNTTNGVANLSVADGTVDTFTSVAVRGVSRVSPNPNDFITVYKSRTDFSWSSATSNKLTWLNATLEAPELDGYSVAGTTLNAFDSTAYNYKVTALGTDGETIGSNKIAVTSADTTSYHRLEWTKVPLSTGYKVYDSTGVKLLVTIADPNRTYYDRKNVTDTTAGTIGTGTAKRRPATGTDYYVDFTGISYDTNVNLFNSLYDVENTYGIGSEIANMAEHLFKYINVPELYIVGANASAGSTSAGSFINAIDKLSLTDDVNYVVAMSDSTSVQNYVITHASNNSTDAEAKEREGIVCISNDNITVAGVRAKVAVLDNNKRGYVVIPNGNKVYKDVYKTVDNSGNVTYVNNQLVPNYFVAGAVAGKRVMAIDPATSVINETLDGFNYGTDSGAWNDGVVKNYFETDGATYILNKNGKLVIYNDNTLDTSLLENNEMSVLSGEDEMRRRLRANINVFLGKKITQGLIAAVRRRVEETMNQLIAEQLISSYTGLSVTQNATEKVTINIAFSYYPAYPLKEIKFNYSFTV